MFEFPVDACVVTRVGAFSFLVQPEDGVSPQQVLEFGEGSCYLDGQPFGTLGFEGVWDLPYILEVGGSIEYESLRF